MGKSLRELAERCDNTFMQVERVKGFEKDPEKLDYRFRWILKRTKHIEPTSVLDVGCGNGTLLFAFHGKGFAVSGVDISKVAVKAATSNLPDDVVIKEGRADIRIPFEDESFEVVTCLEVLEHVENMEKLIEELWRVCKKGGTILLTTPIDHAYDCSEHINYFDFYKLEELFEKYTDNFKISKIFKAYEREERLLFGVEVKK